MMKQISAAVLLISFFVGGCAPATQPISTAGENIGAATMAEDGTITLDLIARGDRGEIGHGVVKYSPSDLHYAEVFKHLGGISPGERKPVPPWPDR